MKSLLYRIVLGLFVGTLCPALMAEGISPEALDAQLKAGEPLAVIDIRPGAEYQQNHIPGAMNIPARALNPSRVPASRALVLYDDGMGRSDAQAVVVKIRATGRTDVFWLKGGLAAWESAGKPGTAETGFSRDHVPAITYHRLIATKGKDVIVMDLRTAESPPEAGTVGLAGGTMESALTNLGSLLPGARVVRNETAKPGTIQIAGSSQASPLEGVDPAEELIVVVDDGDGSGEALVRSLRAAGNRRVVLLAGGEEILKRQGRPGLERESLGMPPSIGTEPTTDGGAER